MKPDERRAISDTLTTLISCLQHTPGNQGHHHSIDPEALAKSINNLQQLRPSLPYADRPPDLHDELAILQYIQEELKQPRQILHWPIEHP